MNPYATKTSDSKFNNQFLGFILGLIAPLLFLFIFAWANLDRFGSFEKFFSMMFTFQILTKIISLCALPNLGLFLFFSNNKLDKSAKGVVFVTMMMVLAMLYFTL